jgi:hypothetical protein
MMAHSVALQLPHLQSLVEIGVDQITTVVFPATRAPPPGVGGDFGTGHAGTCHAGARAGRQWCQDPVRGGEMLSGVMTLWFIEVLVCVVFVGPISGVRRISAVLK